MKIPNQIKVRHVTYEVLWIKEFPENAFYGQCDGAKKQIILQSGLSEVQTAKTFFHELLHAISFEYKLPIPHRLISKLEGPLLKLFTANGLSFS